jgi:NAD(P)H-dependent FMN reductase
VNADDEVLADRGRLRVVSVSTRPGRVGPVIARWFVERCLDDGRFEIEVADLAELALPMMDEPHPPRLRRYIHDHTVRWSEIVDSSDAFVFVMPEYNHGFSGALKNALDYLHDEWALKPVGFVSYGGISGGMRAVQLLKPVLSALRMIPVPDQVALANFSQHLHDGVFAPDPAADQACTLLLDDLSRVLDVLRRPAAATA